MHIQISLLIMTALSTSLPAKDPLIISESVWETLGVETVAGHLSCDHELNWDYILTLSKHVENKPDFGLFIDETVKLTHYMKGKKYNSMETCHAIRDFFPEYLIDATSVK